MNYFGCSLLWVRDLWRGKKNAAVFPSGAMDQVLSVLLGTSECTLNRPWHDLTARCPTCVTCSGRSLSGGPSDSPLLLEPPWVCCWRSQADLGGGHSFLAYATGEGLAGQEVPVYPCQQFPVQPAPVPLPARGAAASPALCGACVGVGTASSDLEAGFLWSMSFSSGTARILQKSWGLVCFQGKVFKYMVLLNWRLWDLLWGCGFFIFVGFVLFCSWGLLMWFIRA